FKTDPGAHRDVGSELGEDRQPAQQEVLPQSDPATDRERCVISAHDADLLTCLLYGPGEQCCVTLKLSTGRGQGGPRLVTDEQLGPELLFQALDPGDHRGMRDMKSLRSLHEATRCDHGEKSASEFCIHRSCRYLAPIFVACKIQSRY